MNPTVIEAPTDTMKVIVDTLALQDSTAAVTAVHPWTGVLFSLAIGVVLGLVYLIRK